MNDNKNIYTSNIGIVKDVHAHTHRDTYLFTAKSHSIKTVLETAFLWSEPITLIMLVELVMEIAVIVVVVFEVAVQIAVVTSFGLVTTAVSDEIF